LAYVGMATVGKMTLGQHWKNNVGTTLLNKWWANAGFCWHGHCW
jgi:hypothetical protein